MPEQKMTNGLYTRSRKSRMSVFASSARSAEIPFGIPVPDNLAWLVRLL